MVHFRTTPGIHPSQDTLYLEGYIEGCPFSMGFEGYFPGSSGKYR
jgi:hypothetical protein